MNVYDAIISRRSTRRFQNHPVPEDKLNLVLEAGRYAPSGGNSQTTHFFVIIDPCELKRLADLAEKAFAAMEVTEGMYRSLASSVTRSKQGGYVFHYSCPVLIVTANRKDYGNNIADCACALENMMIMANDLDLGSCWINQLRWLNEDPELLSVFKGYGMAEDERVYGALALGFADSADGMPERRPLQRTGNPVTRIG